MEYAARLLRTTTDSLAEIAGKVGYESQSKLTAAFKGLWRSAQRIPEGKKKTAALDERLNDVIL